MMSDGPIPRPAVRHTHTYAMLTVSPTAFAEVGGLLRAALYDHAFQDGGSVIVMQGLALVAQEATETPAQAVPRLCQCAAPPQAPEAAHVAAVAEVARLRARVDELLNANNGLLERARQAEGLARRRRDQLEGWVERMVRQGMAPEALAVQAVAEGNAVACRIDTPAEHHWCPASMTV